MVPFVQRAEKMSTSANYLHSWTNADLLYVALELSKNYLYRLDVRASDSTLPLLNISDKTAAIFLFSFPPVNFCQITVIDYNNCKAAGQQISSQQDLPIPSLPRWSKIGLLSLSLHLLCFSPLQRVCSVEHLAETCKPWRLAACLITLIASRGWIQYCSWKAAGIISF